jgi:hypothetical protein
VVSRLKGIKDWPVEEARPRKRSNSLPIPKIEVNTKSDQIDSYQKQVERNYCNLN